jgi:Transposase DDE domain
MSHQDKEGSTSFPYHFQALKDALLWLFDTADLSAIQFREDCSWSALGLIFTALLWSWSDEKSLTQRFFTARKICFKALGKLALGSRKGEKGEAKKPAGSYQAFMKMLQTWTTVLVLQLMVVFRQRMRTALPDRQLIAGFEVFAVDGSRLELPRTKSNESRFSAQSARKRRRAKGAKRRKSASHRDRAERSRAKKANSPQIWLTIMWHVATGLPWDWRTGPSDSSERDHFRQMITALPNGALVTGDAGFVGYHYWKEVIDSGRQLLIRVGGNVRLLKNLGYIRQKQDLVYLWPDEVAAKRLPPWFCVWLSFMMEGIPVTWPPPCSMRSDSQTDNWRRSTGFAGESRCFTATSSKRSSGVSCGASRRTTPKSKPSGHFWDCGRWRCMPSRSLPPMESPPDGSVSRKCCTRIAGRCANIKVAQTRANP